MALNSMGLSFVFTARDLASGTIQRLNQNFQGLQQRSVMGSRAMQAGFLAAGASIGSVLGGMAALRGLREIADASGQFGMEMAAVGAVTRATASDMALLNDAAIRAGIATQFSPLEAAQGLNTLATAGQTATQAMQTLIPALDLAAGGRIGVDESAAAVVGTLNAYQMAATEATNVTDKLLRVTQLTNFQARDFETGLAKSAAAAATFGTSLDDTLITVGLLRNRNIDASSASTAFREAIRRAASDQRAQAGIMASGTRIFDEQTGAMRSIVDIIADMVDNTRGLSDEQRNAQVVQAFGARGLLAFNAIQTATFTTMRNGEQVTLQGREAIAALRHEMGNATGTANDFRETLLDTFEGQKVLLDGVRQTLMVTLGEPLARVFRPFVELVRTVATWITEVFRAMPKPVQTFIMGLVVATATMMVFMGVLSGVALIITLMIPLMKTLLLTFVVMGVVMLPLIAVIGTVIGVIGTFVYLTKRNVGGLGDFFRRTVDRIKLAWGALGQLFESGEFSGRIREEMGRAENQGVRDFVISLYRIGHRIKEFFGGLGEGVGAALEAGRPYIEAFKTALGELFDSFGFVQDGLNGLANQDPNRFRNAGQSVGQMLGRGLLVVVRIITSVAQFWTGFIRRARTLMEEWAPSFRRLGDAFRRLFGGDARGQMDGMSDGAKGFGEIMAEVVVPALAFAAEALAVMINLVNDGRAAWRWMSSGIVEAMDTTIAAVLRFQLAWENVGDTIRVVFYGMAASIGDFINGLPSVLRSGLGLSEVDTSALRQEQGLAASRMVVRTNVTEGVIAERASTAALGAQERATLATRAEAGQQALVSNVQAQIAAQRRQQPVVVQAALQIDGETLARATARSDRAAAADGFAPVGVAED